MVGALQRGGLRGQCMQGRERLLNLETFAGKLCVALVDSRKCSGKVAPMKRLHDLRRSLPAVATGQASRRFKCSKMVLRVEAIAARATLCFRDQATGLVIAHLLDTDTSSQCEIVGTQIGTICHVKLLSAIRDFSTMNTLLSTTSNKHVEPE